MKKIKLFNSLIIGVISTIAVFMPLFTLSSCNKSELFFNRREFIANDGMTIITLLNDNCKLENRFDNVSIQKLINQENTSMKVDLLICSNFSWIENNEAGNFDEHRTSVYDEKLSAIYLLEKDFLNFSSLFKINGNSILIKKIISNNDPKFVHIKNPYMLMPVIGENFPVGFAFNSFKVNIFEKKLTFTLSIGCIETNEMKQIWTANLGEFTFANVME